MSQILNLLTFCSLCSKLSNFLDGSTCWAICYWPREERKHPFWWVTWPFTPPCSSPPHLLQPHRRDSNSNISDYIIHIYILLVIGEKKQPKPIVLIMKANWRTELTCVSERDFLVSLCPLAGDKGNDNLQVTWNDHHTVLLSANIYIHFFF